MRTPAAIRREIAALSERRADLWQELGTGREELREDVTVLSGRIEELWRELRSVQASLRTGPRDEIIARARRTERADQELGRRLNRR